MFEKPGANLERNENIEKLTDFVANLAKRYRSENIPVNDDGRIDMQAYKHIYPDVQSDFNRTWESRPDAKELREKQLTYNGERLELLAHAILAKNLGDQFVVARSSPYDDFNNVDTLLLDRESGNLVCAFDEVGDTTGNVYEKKQSTVQQHNLEGGVSVKYGLAIEERDGKKVVMGSSAKNIPIFYIALPADRIQKGMEEFSPDFNKQSDFEKKLFTYFLATLSAQINGLELYGKKLNPNLKQKLDAFKKMVNDLNSKPEKKKV